MKLRLLSVVEAEGISGGDPLETFITSVCGGFGAVAGQVVGSTVGAILGGAAAAAYCDALLSSPTETSNQGINGLSSADINNNYSRAVYMDGHEVRNGDPYNRWN